MTTTLLIVIVLSALILGLIIGSALTRIASEYQDMKNNIQTLSVKLEMLESAQKHRNPYRTNEALEDAMAIIHDSVWQADATLDYVRARMRQVNTTLKTIRNDPDTYDPNQPNQKK
jgi:prefoldin subunit 5